jgi:hypothetical protein
LCLARPFQTGILTCFAILQKCSCNKRSLSSPSPESFYQQASKRLQDKNHVLLTRAVLVKNLLDIATQTSSIDAMLEEFHNRGTDFFYTFVHNIIEREANEKWIDRSGTNDIAIPLLSVEEHCELLSLIATEMWISSTDYIRNDYLTLITDFFCESKQKNPTQSYQIRERLRGHAMLISSANGENAIEFDHNEFQYFFLGEGIARHTIPQNEFAKNDIKNIFRRGTLPQQARESLYRALSRNEKVNRFQLVEFFLNVGQEEASMSFTQENCGNIVLRLLDNQQCDNFSIKNDTVS